ncbi:hypothetical protein [Tomitella biformata]|uniref:hypothetical protein n=1 Tax=Tomitella biformata TaxID=630403 RepID=UPI0004659E70|nr:hypothetical protein [Tomitella biformata]
MPGETSSLDWITICTAEIAPDVGAADVEVAAVLPVGVVELVVAFAEVVGCADAVADGVAAWVAGSEALGLDEQPAKVRSAVTATIPGATSDFVQFVITR